MNNTSRRTDDAALFAMLSSLADNKQSIGRRYAYWCNGAPALEAAVAAAAMTQDELGHARTLYPLLADFVQAEADPAQIEPETRTLHYSLAFLDKDFAGWSDFVATNFLFDTALTTFFEAAQNSTYEPLRQRSRKIVQEERIHLMHGEGWVRRLSKAGGAVKRTLVSSLTQLWDETLCWFGPHDDPVVHSLYKRSILDSLPDELRSRYMQKVMPILQQVDIEMPVMIDELLWARWDNIGRRLNPVGA
jgi:phenylacetate-CoA oxygenase PaaI subunit